MARYAVFCLCFVFLLSKGTNLIAGQPAESLFGEKKSYDHVLVDKVTSANSFILEGGEKIQLIGLTVPEAPKRKKVERDEHGFIIEKLDPSTSFEEQAFEFTKTLLEGKYIRLEFDAEKKSEDFKTLAYAFLKNNTFVNAEIIRQGFGDLKILPPNTKHAKELREAYQEARQEKRGVQSE